MLYCVFITSLSAERARDDTKHRLPLPYPIPVVSKKDTSLCSDSVFLKFPTLPLSQFLGHDP